MNLQHPNIIRIKEVVTGSEKDKIYVVMEYMENELKDLLENLEERLTIGQIKCLIRQLLEAVDFLHSRFIIHRDLKTSNLLIGNDGHLKVCDFGFARTFATEERPYSPNVVTLWYRAPELLLTSGTYTEAVDIWSVGCIFAEIVLGEPLLKGKTEMDQIELIFKCLGIPSEQSWPGFLDILAKKQVPKSFLSPTPSKLAERFSKVNSEGSVFFNHQGFDLLSKMLLYNPRTRINAKEALNHSWFREEPLPCAPADMPKFKVLNTVPRDQRENKKKNKPAQ